MEIEGEEVGNTGDAGILKESWEELVMAIRIIGARLSDLTRSVLDLGTDISEMAQTNKSVADTAKEFLVEFWDLTWIQDQTKGLLHVVAKRLESLDGVEVIKEREVESEKKKTESGSGSGGQSGKGKEKEVIPELKDESEESGDEEEEGEDVVKGLEISTLDVDESMEAEKDV